MFAPEDRFLKPWCDLSACLDGNFNELLNPRDRLVPSVADTAISPEVPTPPKLQEISGENTPDPIVSIADSNRLEFRGDRDPLTGTDDAELLNLDETDPLLHAATDSVETPVDLGVVETVRDTRDSVGFNPTENLYRFDLSATTAIAVVLYGMTNDADLEVWQDTDGNGELDAGERLGGSYNSDENSEILSGVLAAGTYYVRVRLFDGETPYNLKIDTDIAAVATNRSSDSLATAIDLGAIAEWHTERDRLDGLDPHDTYRLPLHAASEIAIVAYGTDRDLQLSLIRDDNGNGVFDFGEAIVRSDPGNPDIHQLLSPGTYYVQVSNFSGSTDYSLGFHVNPIPDNAGNSLAAARDLGLLETRRILSDRVAEFDPDDYYRFEVATPQPLSVAVSGLTADADLEIIRDTNDNGFVESGEVIAGSYRSENHLDERRIGQLDPGTYYVRVSRYSGNTEYTLTLFPELYSFHSGQGKVNALAAVSAVTGMPTQDAVDTSFEVDVPVGINTLDAPDVWSYGIRGDGVIVAVVDSGVDLDHIDLAANIWQNVDEVPENGVDDDGNGYVDDVRGWDFVEFDNDPNDRSGHGTHVAGTIAALDNGFGVTGVAPDATILPVRVMDEFGFGTEANIADGIRYAVDNGARIINLSLGGSRSEDIEAAVDYAAARDAFVVMASGNEGSDVPMFPAYNAYRSGIAVGAIDDFDSLTPWSNRAALTDNYVVAPGAFVYSTVPDNRYAFNAGTSMAAPHVAGVAALVRSADPGSNVEQVRSAIVDTATAIEAIA